MPTRADLILKTKTELSDLHFNVPVVDTPALGHIYHYALNDALGQLGYGVTDGDITSMDYNDVRRATIGCQYYFVRAIVKKKLSEVRVDHDNVSRDSFGKIMELWRILQDEWKDALSGKDTPPEISRPAESVVTWTTGTDGSSPDRSREGNNFQRNQNDFFIDDLGIDRTTYNDDGE